MPPKRRKKRKASVPVDTVGSSSSTAVGATSSTAVFPGPIEDVFEAGEVKHVITMVARRRVVVSGGFISAHEMGEWVNNVTANLERVGICSLKDIVRTASSVNTLLSLAKLPQLHTKTRQEILDEVILLIGWPGETSDDE